MIKQNAEHLYRLGDAVLLGAGASFFKLDTPFTIVARLPPLGTELQYRIKSAKEPYERVVLEHQLTPEPLKTAGIAAFSSEGLAAVL